MRRRVPGPIFWLTLAAAVAPLASPRRAHAEPTSAANTEAPPRMPEPGASRAAPPPRSGLELLANVGWGASTNDVLRLQLSPYGASFGLDAGYLWPSGFRLGAYLGHSLGRSVLQSYDPAVGNAFALTAETSSSSFGLSVAYDVALYALVLRYHLGIGATLMSWDFAPTSPNVARYAESPAVGLHVAPGAALLCPHEWFVGGIGFRYLVQADGALPSGFLGELLVGVRL